MAFHHVDPINSAVEKYWSNSDNG